MGIFIGLADVVLLLVGLLLVIYSRAIRGHQESNLTNPPGVFRAVRIYLLGLALIVAAIVLLLAEVAPPAAVLLLALTAAWLVACTTRRFRRVHAESDTIFRCQPEKAFALLADPRIQPLLYQEVERIELLPPGDVSVGTVARAWLRLPGRPGVRGLYLVVNDEIIEYEPPHRYASRIVGKPAQTRTVFRPVDGGTHVAALYDSLIEFEAALTGGVFYRHEAERLIIQSRKKAWEQARRLLEEPAA